MELAKIVINEQEPGHSGCLETKKISFSRLKKGSLIFSLLQLFIGISIAQVHQAHKGQVDSSKVPVLDFHYQPEHTFDTSTEPARWESDQKGLQVAFGSTDALYFRTEVPDLKKESDSWSETGWRGERLNAQVLVWSSDTLEQVRFKLNDLVSGNGNRISKSNSCTRRCMAYTLCKHPCSEPVLTPPASHSFYCIFKITN